MFCRQAIGRVASIYDRLKENGIEVAFVHMSSEETAARVFAKYGLPDVARFSDPEKKLYSQFGLRRGKLLQLLKPSVMARSVGALLSGYAQGRVEGDPYQLGGAFLLQQGVVVREFRSIDFSDQPDFEAVCGLRGRV